MSFHRTECTHNGRTYHAGDVYECHTMADSAWSQHVVLGFDDNNEARLSRPYAYASCTGTTGPVVLLGAETYSLPVWHMEKWALLASKRFTV